MSDSQSNKTISRRSAARIAAVQALYEMAITDAPVDPVLEEFLARRWNHVEGDGEGPSKVPAPDKALMKDIVRGVQSRLADLDGMIEAALTNEWKADRLEVLLRSILRAGAYELLARSDIDAKVVITEYLDMAHAFYEGPEPKMVNGVLDRLARKLREDA